MAASGWKNTLHFAVTPQLKRWSPWWDNRHDESLDWRLEHPANGKVVNTSLLDCRKPKLQPG